MSRVSLLIAVVGHGQDAEAEPVTLEVDGHRATLIFDDGRVVSFDRAELEAATRSESLRSAAA